MKLITFFPILFVDHLFWFTDDAPPFVILIRTSSLRERCLVCLMQKITFRRLSVCTQTLTSDAGEWLTTLETPNYIRTTSCVQLSWWRNYAGIFAFILCMPQENFFSSQHAFCILILRPFDIRVMCCEPQVLRVLSLWQLSWAEKFVVLIMLPLLAS